ncbi:hypothetical protein [Halomicrobium salinisoli]|uniref:hypothetical protein n=1 Tax=Halomicrobium salinisoli TaxID=2878391 RepID=UPI001CEFCFEB|nr:hypothetical protein [Halomicrobium salinisoli]
MGGEPPGSLPVTPAGAGVVVRPTSTATVHSPVGDSQAGRAAVARQRARESGNGTASTAPSYRGGPPRDGETP